MKKIDGTVVHKYVDRDGMEWEYEQKVLKLDNSLTSSNVMVFNGPWTPETRSDAVKSLPLGLLVIVLMLGTLTIVNSSIQFIDLNISAHLFGHSSN